jgi:hypothetical protein
MQMLLVASLLALAWLGKLRWGDLANSHTSW